MRGGQSRVWTFSRPQGKYGVSASGRSRTNLHRNEGRLATIRELRSPGTGGAQRVETLSNDFGFLLQNHYADPEREPPGECCQTSQHTLSAANPG
jgi:hypothetical protein